MYTGVTVLPVPSYLGVTVPPVHRTTGVTGSTVDRWTGERCTVTGASLNLFFLISKNLFVIVANVINTNDVLLNLIDK
jgi:hypothetical protein